MSFQVDPAALGAYATGIARIASADGVARLGFLTSSGGGTRAIRQKSTAASGSG